jgi:hypothetical protein
MTPRERADRAKEMLESPVFKSAFADVREALVSSMEASGFGDVDVHHELVLSLQLLRKLKTQFIRYADVIAIDKAQEKQESWLRKARQSLAS